MERIFDQLDEVKVEGETDSDSLRAQNQEEKLEFDKLAKELHAMSKEICELRKMYEEVQSGLHKKELICNQISCANEKLEAEYNEKILKLEGENRVMVLSLDEAFARIRNVEKNTAANSDEISGFKRLLSITQQLNSEMQKNASMKERDRYLIKLEEESRISQDQLKWKKEQFSPLEEAQRKLQTLLQASKLEWQKEKSSLLDEISSLQDTLDARNRASEILEAKLRMSNQALAYEASRRKVLEIENMEPRSKFENVFLECRAARSEIDQSTMKREDEIAELRILLTKNEILANEMNYIIQQLEQENSDLLVSLKSNQEVHVNNNAALSSFKRLKNNLHCAEQLNGKCVMNLTEEAGWNSQIEKLKRDTSCCLSQLVEKNRGIRELHKVIEEYQSLLEVQNAEIFASIAALKSELHVAYSKLNEMKEELEQRSDKIAVLVERVESLESLNQKDNLMEEELRRYKSIHEESKQCQSHLKQLENAQEENIKNAVERVNIKLQNKTSEIEAIKFELQKSESGIVIPNLNLKEEQQAHEQEENTILLVTVNDKDAKIVSLEQRISMLKSLIIENSEDAEMLNQEDSYIRPAEDRNCCIKTLEKEIAQLRNKLAEREVEDVAILDANYTLRHVNEMLLSSIIEKDHKVQVLQKEFESLDHDFKSAMISLAEKDSRRLNHWIHDEVLKEAEGQKILDVEEKNQEINRLCEKVEFQEKLLLQSMQMALQSEEKKKSEIQELRSQLEMETRCFDYLLEELKSHKQAFLEINKENLLAQLENMCQQIGLLSTTDVELMGRLSPLFEGESEPARNLLSGDGVSNTFSLSRKNIQVNFDERIPLKELNVSSI